MVARLHLEADHVSVPGRAALGESPSVEIQARELAAFEVAG